MKEKYLTNARIIDPKNQIDEIGGLIIDTKGLIKAIGKKVANGNLPADAERIDLKKRYNFNSIVNIETDLFNNIWTISADGEIFVLDGDYNLKKTFNYLGIDKIESCLNYQNSNNVYSLCSYVDGGSLGILSFIYNSNGIPEYQDFYLSKNDS